jgi:uncharacterized protein YbaR (Trm112 family)
MSESSPTPIPPTTNYGSGELRAFAKGLLIIRCPECDNTEHELQSEDVEGRITCRHCNTRFRAEDSITIALLKAYQCGLEGSAQASSDEPDPEEICAACAGIDP